MIMMSEGGYSLTDLHGREYAVTKTRPPTLLEEARGVDYNLASAAAGLVVVALFFAGAGALLVLACAVAAFAGVVWFQLMSADANKRVEREKASSDGMSEKEVQRRAAEVNEVLEYRADEAEDAKRQAENKGKSGRAFGRP